MHVRQVYGGGYQLEVSLREAHGSSAVAERLADFAIAAWGPATRLLEQHASRCVFQLPASEHGGLSLSDVFASLKISSEELGIEDYALQRPSLELVFLAFARVQEAADGTAVAHTYPALKA